MNPVESIQHYFVLLFWYIGERNWTVQSTSSIVKPRKEADEYQPGDIVIAKFQGKPYKAVIVRIEDSKEALADDRVSFDKLLHDASLSPSQILEKMGIVADLEDKKDDTSIKTNITPGISNSQVKSVATKRPIGNQQKKSSLQKVKKTKVTETKQTKSPADIKMQEKQKRIATIESSKLMAARLLQGTKTDKELQVSNSPSVKMPTVIHSPTTISFTTPYTQPLPSFQQLSGSSSTVLPHLSTQNHIACSSSEAISFAHTNDTFSVSLPSAIPSPSTSSCIPNFSTPETQETYTATLVPFQQQNTLSPIQSQSRIALPADNSYQHPSSLYDWDYSGSASELIANSFTNEDGRGLTQSLDCSKCMPLIHSLTQRINTLEEKLESIISANKHTSKHPAPAIPYAASSLHTTSTISSPVPASQSATPNQSLSSLVHQTTTDKPTCTDTENNNGLTTVELLPGYGVEITVPQLDACLRKSKGSGTALARLLLNVYFDEKTLAASSVRGTKSKPALDTAITSAIINYVCSKRNCAEKDVVQAINQKCADARVTLALSCKKK